MDETLRQRLSKKRVKLLEKYEMVGFISSGTYGKVYKAKNRYNSDGEYAVKKFKPEKEMGVIFTHSLMSQSAFREIVICKEICHENVVKLFDVFVDPTEKSISMVFEYAEYDLLSLLHHHAHHLKLPFPEASVKSAIWQTLNGLHYLHSNWILHRDLKPANILVASNGVVKIADLGLARLYQGPLQSLHQSDRVVVTIWYRPPELLLGSQHYTNVIDCWAIGCIMAELILLRPLFKGDEVKHEKTSLGSNKNGTGGASTLSNKPPFQRDQIQRIMDVMGAPSVERWPLLPHLPDYKLSMNMRGASSSKLKSILFSCPNFKSEQGVRLVSHLLEYDPGKRCSAEEAMSHPYFSEDGGISGNIFVPQSHEYPVRKLFPTDHNDNKSRIPNPLQNQQFPVKKPKLVP